MFIRSLVLILATAFASAAFADQPQTIRVIPKSYVSPGASGSVSGSSSYQQHNLYGGQRLPQGSVRQESSYGSYSSESRGGIRQSTEYPGGLIIERQPGSGSYQQQRSR
ncbi:hypothetical protein N5E99_07010 [Pseudomonas chengduensis]|jgi:hypothetical protein|uniref:Uncharacterized protein n=1 Tax=Pseudomonas sihuiensis TaxID=1274359 RepID=A0A1H2LXD3_9PSED|nr:MULTISPECIES: hypothetical protein [Pseudomonas]MDH0958797.1 hypothetical protein [Pseudomonas chengduensis]MDH1535503.1 hypothetical protein [Pseudomonas chengduensis]MDH1560978.1 hypothetical protein [Pseudomonas chengduensis]MDH1620814.1 hypothetical protein [Pseudomonas chengduensis]MDH1730193.1 hypothetical protein [Pseudomonas chengduensis]